jgi:DNA-binding NarL/FixJ family response regulator
MPVLLNRQHTAVLLEDHKLFAETFSAFLEKSNLFTRVIICHDEKEVLDHLIQGRKNLESLWFFMDYFIPDCNVLHLMGDIRRLYPKAVVIIISSVTHAGLIQRILEQKPNAFLSKAVGLAVLMECLQSIGGVEPYLSADIREILQNQEGASGKVEFTSKEMQVLALIAKGYGIEKIAEALHLSRHTVITHRRNMLKKTSCHSVTELLAFAVERGLVYNS